MTTDLDTVLDSVIDDHDHNTSDATTRGRSYVDAVGVREISTDHTYQRPLDAHRVGRMVAEYDQSLVGVIEVSLRPDGTYRVIDGQHRLAMVRQVRGAGAHVACNVHTGLTPEQEAQLFFDIDKKRRRLTGWDRWNARRGAGEAVVLDIERIAAAHGLKIDPSAKPMHLRCVAACEKLLTLAGLTTLDETLSVCVAAYGGEPDSLRAEIVHGVGLVLAFYPADTLDRGRLVTAMQGIAPRQLSARAAALRESVSGQLPRLAASVLVDRYNAEPGRKVPPFLKHVPTGKTPTPGKDTHA